MGEIKGKTEGLFKRESKGRSTKPISVSVERGRVRFFAQALGDTDPVHRDVDHARARGHLDLVTPLSFFMVIEALANEEARRRGDMDILEMVGADFRYLLHGSERYNYKGLILAGDEVSLTSHVLDFYEKKGGAMEFVEIESIVTHAERGVLLRVTRILLHKFA